MAEKTDWLYGNMEVLEREGGSLSPEKRIKEAVDPLLSWYRNNARCLPWRDEPEPYHVWISEIMLQQTRVEAVKAYYKRFLETLPDIQALACVEEERLFKLWEGLGYYNRARNLKKAAMKTVSEYDGKLPDSYEELLSLPGIGSYTAGAIASIAYGIPVPAVDGNVLRVISRLLASEEDILRQSVKKQVETLLRKTMPEDMPGEFNQALMEIGALVCIPNGQPHCEKCPLKGICLARRCGKTDVIPVKKPKKPRKIEKRTVFAVVSGSQVLIHKRPDTGLLSGLYEIPNAVGHMTKEQAVDYLGISEEDICLLEPLSEAKHIFSHIEWHMTGYFIKLSESFEGKEKLLERNLGEFVDRETAGKRYALPGAFKAYAGYLFEHLR